MKKIEQGRYEIFANKADAIERFMHLRGVCREKLNGEDYIEFCCFRNGEITITNPPRRGVKNVNSTNLFAEIIEQDGKTYVTYYTSFNKINNALKSISLLLDIIFAVFALAFTFVCDYKLYSVIVFALCLVFFVYRMSIVLKEKNNSPNDSKILIRELEKRVEAVNLWDK